jgi:hypothetical protein
MEGNMHTVRSTMMSALVLTAIVAAPSLAVERSGPTTTRRDLTFGTVAAYGGGALLGGALIAGVGGIVSMRAYYGAPGACIGYSLGSAAGATVAGALLKDNGRFLPSFVWAGSAMAAAAGMFYLGGHQFSRLPGAVLQTLGVATGCLVPAFACVGYIRSWPATGLAARIVPGGLTWSRTRLPDGTSEPAFDLRIANVRF